MKTRRIICVMLAALLVCMQIPAGAEGDKDTVTYLTLDGQRLNYRTAKEKLAGYSCLKKVDMYDIPVDWRQAEELEALYPGVEFGWTLKIGGDHLVRTDATAFSTLHWSNSTPHPTEEIRVLRYCKQLRALDFGHNGVDDISWLAELPELRVLIIAVNRVTDITPLASLTKLEYLEMFNNRITDLTPLQGLTHLMDLNICWNRIRDYSPLYGMTGLKRLWLWKGGMEENGVPEEVINTLKERLPECRLNWQARPTLGGWRVHPHHDVISKMFEKKEGMHYIPFSDSYPDYPVDDEEDDL
ncbi:MAG: leucine-rich repeat domain-containing protein [Clostridiales bacterium]|nr:leucine-rich repeat domain-containing protein [Clostridiales bacterium]